MLFKFVPDDKIHPTVFFSVCATNVERNGAVTEIRTALHKCGISDYPNSLLYSAGDEYNVLGREVYLEFILKGNSINGRISYCGYQNYKRVSPVHYQYNTYTSSAALYHNAYTTYPAAYTTRYV